MAERTFAATARLAGVVFLLAFATASEAYEDVYWHGRRSSNWTHGIAGIAGGEVSNWYTRLPLQGEAKPMPGHLDTAIFARGAKTYTINIPYSANNGGRLVGSMAFRYLAPQYTFNIAPKSILFITGKGIINNSTAEPRFNIRSQGVVSFSDGNARLISSTAARPALFFLEGDSRLRFNSRSRAGTAWAANRGGNIGFHDDASADRMTITNYSSFNPPFSRIDFHNRSTGGKVHIVNQYNGTVNFTTTLGPTGNGWVSAGKIQNFGLLYIGTRGLRVTDTFSHGAPGDSRELHVTIFRQTAGTIVVTNRATLGGGRLYLRVIEPVPGRAYTVISAEGGLVGKFSEVRTTNVNMPRPRVEYTAKGLVLYFNP